MKNIVFPLCAVAAFALTACKPTDGQAVGTASAPVAAPVPAPKPVALAVTKVDWEQAIKATYDEKSTKTDGEGVTEFTACFKRAADGKKCEIFEFGRRDAFNKTVSFTPGSSKLAELASSKYLHAYIGVPDCQRPFIALKAHFFGKSGWLFMDKVAVLADGNLVLEHQFDNAAVHRDNHSWGVDEAAAWEASATERDALKKVTEAKDVIVRISGSKGFVSATADDVRHMKEDFSTALATYAILDTAALSKLPTECK
jgi:hypothetical protein